MAALPVLPKLPLPHAPGSCRHTIYPRQAHFPGLCSPIQKPYGKIPVLCCHESTILGSEVVFSLELTPLAPLDF